MKGSNPFWKGHLDDRIPAALGRELDIYENEIALKKQGKMEDKVFAETRLRRGYAIVQRPDTGAVVTDAGKVRPGERVRARLARGALDCLVEKTRED